MSVGMAAELQPAVEFAMMGEQAAAPIRRENPGGARDVPRPTRPLETIRMRFDERANAIDDGRFVGK
jgi:hypothetical protein